MLWLPTARLDVEKVVAPFDRVPLPRTVVPSSKVTVPVGVPRVDGTDVAVAVNVTG
jgi:hypothetical protein